MIIRNECVFCSNDISKNIIFIEKDCPIAVFSIYKNIEYEYIDLIYCNCNNCDIVQLINLIEPDKMYNISFNNTYNTPLWKEHHETFYIFINNNIDLNKSIVEIGGGNNVFSKLFHNKTQYTILDMFDVEDKLENISYVKINGEKFNYINTDTIIMSHVFEHLYNPKAFVEKIREENVSNIYISIPNLKKCVEKNSICHISLGHNFFYEDTNIIKLFNNFNYQLRSKEYFKDHSIFFNFTLIHDYNIINNKTEYNGNIGLIKNNLLDLSNKIYNLEIYGDSFIVPAGGYGSKIYYYMNTSNKSNIICFLDNDITKQNKYLYGTDKTINSLDILSNYKYPTVILNAGEHTINLISQINTINSKCNIIDLYNNK